MFGSAEWETGIAAMRQKAMDMGPEAYEAYRAMEHQMYWTDGMQDADKLAALGKWFEKYGADKSKADAEKAHAEERTKTEESRADTEYAEAKAWRDELKKPVGMEDAGYRQAMNDTRSLTETSMRN